LGTVCAPISYEGVSRRPPRGARWRTRPPRTPEDMSFSDRAASATRHASAKTLLRSPAKPLASKGPQDLFGAPNNPPEPSWASGIERLAKKPAGSAETKEEPCPVCGSAEAMAQSRRSCTHVCRDPCCGRDICCNCFTSCTFAADADCYRTVCDHCAEECVECEATGCASCTIDCDQCERTFCDACWESVDCVRRLRSLRHAARACSHVHHAARAGSHVRSTYSPAVCSAAGPLLARPLRLVRREGRQRRPRAQLS
jgi:hypothetical protein